MLEYQKSSAAAPKPHNCFGLKYLGLAGHFVAAYPPASEG
jgi:hypothetical protein